MQVERKFPSKSNPSAEPYTVLYNTETRTASCNCRGWTTKKEGKERSCTHTKRVMAEFGVEGAPAPEPVAALLDSRLFDPMLASAMTKGQRVSDFSDAEYALEEKYNGHRILLAVEGGRVVETRSREGNARALPEHVQVALSFLPDGIYDGELRWPGGRSTDVTRGDVQDELEFVMFDIAEFGGTVLIDLTYDLRRVRLEQAFELASRRASHVVMELRGLALSQQFPVSQASVDAIWDRGGEGAILKRRASVYEPGARDANWLKVKRNGHVRVTVRGFETGDTGIAFGKTLWVDEHGYLGSVKTKNNRIIREVAVDPRRFVGRGLVVKFTERLASGAYEHPMFDHWAGEAE